MLKVWKRALTHEDLFLEHYGWLRTWARQLTAHDAGQADDLLHDAFVRFAVSRPPLETIVNPQAYLYTLLRNLHLSHLRRANAPPVTDLSAVDAESVRDVLARVQAEDLLKVRQELEVVCEWACARKDAFKGAGYLILRFFHGYVPGEIARIGRTSAKTVDDFLRLARHEARAVLKVPVARRRSRAAIDPAEPDAFIHTLLGRIFESRRDRCVDEHALAAEYDRTDSIATPRLAHIVSCPGCMDRVNRLLGLASRDDRTPGEGRRGPRDPGGAGPSATTEGVSGSSRPGRTKRQSAPRGGQAFQARGGDLSDAAESAEAIREDRPNDLLLAANGWIVAWHPVNSAVTEQQVSLPIDEQLGFVEVFNGAGLGLLYLPVEPPPAGDAEQSAVVYLEHDRVVEARVRFGGPRPTLWVRYADPHFAVPLVDTDPLPAAADPEAPSRERGWRAAIRHRPPRLALAVAWTLIALAALSISDRAWAAVSRIARGVLTSIRGEAQPAPPARLLSRSGAPAYATLPSAPDSRMPPPAPPARPAWSAADIASVEMRVLLALDRVDALMGEQIAVVRQPQGVRVEGIVDGVPRRQAILAALASVVEGPPIDVRVQSVAEALDVQPPAPTGAVIVRDYTIDRGRMPAADAIRRRLAAADPAAAPGDLERRVQEAAGGILDRSRTLLLHAFALDAIVERYDEKVLRELSASAFATWTSLLRRHGWRVRDGAVALRAEILPMVESAADPPSSGAAAREREDVAAIAGVIGELKRLAIDLDDGARNAFTVSPVDRPAGDLRRLVEITARLERLGERVARFEP